MDQSEIFKKNWWKKYNIQQIKQAMELLGNVKLYQFPDREDTDNFIDAYKKLSNLMEKYEDN